MWDKIKLAFHERDWGVVIKGLAAMILRTYLRYVRSEDHAFVLIISAMWMFILFVFSPDLHISPLAIIFAPYLTITSVIAVATIGWKLIQSLLAFLSRNASDWEKSAEQSLAMYEPKRKAKRVEAGEHGPLDVVSDENVDSFESTLRQTKR